MLFFVRCYTKRQYKQNKNMKHLVHKRHHSHLKKRAILEFIGLAILFAFILYQREVIQDSFATVLKVEILWFTLLLGCFWLILPLTAFSYRLITPKPKRLNLFNTILAHLAGAGPGRIIPGGIGNLSISSLHLKKSGLSIEQAIGVVLTNNIFGLFTNIILLVGVLIYSPASTELLSSNVSSEQVYILIGILTVVIVVGQWLSHARNTKDEISKTTKQWKGIFKQFIVHPYRVFAVFAIAVAITLINTFMLDLSAFALGTSLGFTDALIALSFGVIVGSIFPTPGGVGGVEAGIITTLVVLGYDAATATSIAVLFRVATYWQPLIPGTFAYLYLREKKLL